MTVLEAKVSFLDMRTTVVDAVVTLENGQLSLDASGRRVGRWPVDELAPRRIGDAVLISAEGEELVIDAVDPDALSIALSARRNPEADLVAPAQSNTGPPQSTPSSMTRGRRVAEPAAFHRTVPSTEEAASSVPGHVPPSALHEPGAQDVPGAPPGEALDDLRAALATAEIQLRWVQDLVPRRLQIPLREGEAGLGAVLGVRLKERRPQPGSDGLQPWVVVDSGNVYVTDRRLVFTGTQDVEFEFDEISRKGASRTGLLLGVTSRSQAHILAGPGERLAVVLTAAEKIARGVDPTVPFREAIARINSEIDRAERQQEPSDNASVTSALMPIDQQASDAGAISVQRALAP